MICFALRRSVQIYVELSEVGLTEPKKDRRKFARRIDVVEVSIELRSSLSKRDDFDACRQELKRKGDRLSTRDKRMIHCQAITIACETLNFVPFVPLRQVLRPGTEIIDDVRKLSRQRVFDVS